MMNIELDDGLIKLIKRYDAEQLKPCKGDNLAHLSSLIALRVAAKYMTKMIFVNAAKGTADEDLECLK